MINLKNITSDAIDGIDALRMISKASSACLTKALLPDLYEKVQAYCALTQEIADAYEKAYDIVGVRVLSNLYTDEQAVLDWLNVGDSDALYQLVCADYALDLLIKFRAVFNIKYPPDRIVQELVWFESCGSAVSADAIPVLNGKLTAEYEDDENDD